MIILDERRFATDPPPHEFRSRTSPARRAVAEIKFSRGIVSSLSTLGAWNLLQWSDFRVQSFYYRTESTKKQTLHGSSGRMMGSHQKILRK